MGPCLECANYYQLSPPITIGVIEILMQNESMNSENRPISNPVLEPTGLSRNIDKARILVVDDNPSTATTLARAIAHISPNLDVVFATDAMMALEQVKEAAVDLVITDMMMPDMNGLELIEKLRLHPGGGPAYSILITAYDVPGLKESARRIKVNDVLIKPIHPERICQIVSMALETLQPSELVKSRAGPTGLPGNPTGLSHKKIKLLVADDNPSNVTLLSRYLQQEDYSLIVATNGHETLEKTRAEMPGLILLDVNMPGKDGFQVLREIRADPATEHIPVIILTAARLDSADMQFALNLGADDYVTKPFDRRELLARIRTKLRVKEAEDAIRRRNKELSLLPEIGKDLSARLDIDDLTNVVLHRTVETLGALAGHILILNSVTPLHKEYHFSSISTPDFNPQLPQLDTILTRMRASRESIIIDNISESSEGSLGNPAPSKNSQGFQDYSLGWQTKPGDPARSVILVPLLGRLDLIGVLILTHEEAGYFKLEHQLLLQAIASQAAIAIENAQLYARIAREQGRTTAILQSVADPILMFDGKAALLMLNPAGMNLFSECSVQLGEPLVRGCGYEGLIELLEKSCSSGEPAVGEITWPDRRVFSVQFTSIGIDTHGSISSSKHPRQRTEVKQGTMSGNRTDIEGWVVLLHDVSHFKALDRIKDEFISTATHDLKNPITSVLGFSEILATAGPLNETQLSFVNHIHAAAENMRELVQDLLDLAKIDMSLDLKKEKINVNLLVAETVDEFKHQAGNKKQQFVMDECRKQVWIQGDPRQLRQALRNLVGNAIKYTPENGCITVSLECSVSAVLIRVKDTGYGIPPADLPFIFDRFYRVRQDEVMNIEGSGLGLAIVKSVIEQHGGQISVQSEPGKGSVFSCSLPLIWDHPVRFGEQIEPELSQPVIRSIFEKRG